MKDPRPYPQRKWQFDYHRLDVWWVAFEAFIRGNAIADDAAIDNVVRWTDETDPE